MSVPAQITILLGLTAKLFDAVPLDKMTEAEHAVHEAAAKIPPEISARFETVDKLSDEDRAAIIAIATAALAPFQPEPPAKPEPGKKIDQKPGAAAKPGDKAEPQPVKSTPAVAQTTAGQKTDAKSAPAAEPNVAPAEGTKPKPESKSGAETKK